MFLEGSCDEKDYKVTDNICGAFAVLIILLCPCISEVYKDNKISVDNMISELKVKDMEEPLYFNIE